MGNRPRRGTRRPRVRPLLVAAGLAALVVGCSAPPPLYTPAPRLFTAGPEPDYGAYLRATRAHLERHAVAVGDFPRERQIDWRMPFEREPGPGCDGRPQVGLLLIHGLADTPFVFRDLADRLAAHCVRVRAVLLPGHGTRPGDLVAAESGQWLAFARAHARALAGQVDRFYVGGHSMGGAIATILALEAPGRTDGLVALAPSWELDGLRNAIRLAPLAAPFIDFLEHEPEINPVKYESLAVNAGDEIGEIRARVQAAIERGGAAAGMPLLLAATAADSVIDVPYLGRTFAQRFGHRRSRMLVYRDPRAPLPPWWQRQRMLARPSYLPGRRIAELSHQSLPVAAANPLYGPGRPLQHCLEPNGLARRACLARDPGSIWYAAYRGEGERSAGRVTARLTWNPHFDDLAARVAELMRVRDAP